MSRIRLFLLVILFLSPNPILAQEQNILESDDLIVQFDQPLRGAAREVMEIYPGIKKEIEKIFRDKIVFRTTVVLIKENLTFQNMVRNNLTVAFAVPQRDLIVIDYSKMNTHPFTIRIVLKHELSHLYLHSVVGEGKLPKWFDEGVSQWVSGGIPEITIDQDSSVFREAIVSGRFIRISDLAHQFPEEKHLRLLAYKESLSIVEYMDKKFGMDGILAVLGRFKVGDGEGQGISRGISISLDELERDWVGHLKRRATWFIYFSNNLYLILFVMASLLTVYGFVRLVIKRRSYKDEDEDFIDGS